MIQCPICQVLNEDGALFCAECGQRFSQASQPSQPAPAQPPTQAAPPPTPQIPSQPPPHEAPSQENTESRQKGIKLRSPMLGGGEDDEDQGYEQPHLGKLRGVGPKQSNTGRKHLRSPLLGDSDDDDEDLEDSRSGRNLKGSEPTADYGPGTARKKKLRSPLLGEDDDDDGQDFTPDGASRGKRPLRSPLLGQDSGGGDDAPPRARKAARAPEEHHAQPHKRGLHSPLLGGGEDYDEDDDDPPGREAPRKGPTGKPKLRSALLGGGDYDEDYDDDWDEEDDDNPNVLRSPLLAAKKKRPKPEAAPASGVFGASQDLPPGVQVHRPDQQHPPQSAPAPDLRNWADKNVQSGQHQPFQQAPVAAVEAPPQPPPQPYSPAGAPPPFPGPSEPQPPWQQGAPTPPDWTQAAQPQPGQPWPPGPAVQAGPVPGQPAPGADPPLPLEPSTQAPPWQNRMSEPLPSMLDRPTQQGDVPPIVDNNDEFELDTLEPANLVDRIERQMTPSSPLLSAAPPSSQQAPPQRGRPKADFGKSKSEDELKDTLVDEDGPNERRRLDRRRGGTDRRLSSLLEDRSSTSLPPADDEDDFMAPRPKAAANQMARVMFGVGALALGFKIWFFIRVAGMWDLSKMPDFIAEQMFTGLALVGLIVFALSCMKK